MPALRSAAVRFFSRFGRLFLLAGLFLSACAPPGSPPPSTSTSSVPPASPTSAPVSTVPTEVLGTGTSSVVVFVKDGDLLVWDEATGQTQTLLDTDDAIRVTMSDDGQVVAFLRRSIIGNLDSEWHEQSALWAVNRSGENPRELVSAEELRRLFDASETDSTNIPQLEWIPGTHRLLYSGWTYFVQAEGESHAVPEGLYRVDADTGTNTVLAPAGTSMGFAPSPDGELIALMSSAGLAFVDVDGRAHRPDGQTDPGAEEVGPVSTTGVWTQDSSAFVIAGSLAMSPTTNQDFAIWRVPVDGSPVQALAIITASITDSVSFSPDGRYVAFFRHAGPTGQPTDFGWYVASLAPEAGPLAVPRGSYLFWRNLHWSPSGAAHSFAGRTLFQLCPGAVQDTEVCGEGFELGGDLASLYWTDGDRFLYTTREPYDLYFGRLDGARVRIAEGVENFAALPMTCRNDAGLELDGGGPAPQQVAPDTVLLTNWRIRNIGTCTWDPSYRLGFLGGERLSGPSSLFLRETVAPGDEIELLLRVIAPAAAGNYRGQWQMFGPDGATFGREATLDIVVPFDEPTALTPDQIVAKVAVSSNPSRVVLGEGAAWVTNESAGTVSRIDLDTNQVVATVPVGNLPRPVAVGYSAVWVGNIGDGTVSRIDPSTNRVSATIPLGSPPPPFVAEPTGLSAGAGAIWVSSAVVGAESGTVFRIDPATDEIVASITVERWPGQVVALEDAVWVTHTVTPVLSRIDPETNQVAATLDLECPTMGLAADGGSVWAACVRVPVLFRIDPATNQTTTRIAVGDQSEGVALGPDGLWVTSNAEDTLTLIGAESNLAARVYSVGRGPLGVAVSQGEVWVVMSDEDFVWRIRP